MVATEINCSPNDELALKHTIESTRNPNVLTAIITKRMSQKDIIEVKPALDDLRKDIAKADTIKVGFLSLESCDNNCETCIIHDLKEKLEKILITKDLKISHPCQN